MASSNCYRRKFNDRPGDAMKKLWFLLIFLGPLKPSPALALTVTATPNKYMVENTTGTNNCYEFQTRPTCFAQIQGLSISSGTLPSGSTFYIQNTATPSTATQLFSVQQATVTGNFTGQGKVSANNFDSTGSLAPNNGFTQSAANTVTFYTATTPALVLTATQNVTIPNTLTVSTVTASSVTFTLTHLTGPLTAGTTQGAPGMVLVSSGSVNPPTFIYQGIIKSSQCTTLVSSTTASSTYINTTLTCTITPRGTGNNIRISFTGDIQAAALADSAILTIARAGTNILTASGCTSFLGNIATTARAPASCIYTDTATTTAGTSVTYSVQLKSSDNANTVAFPSGNAPTAVMTLDEMGGNDIAP